MVRCGPHRTRPRVINATRAHPAPRISCLVPCRAPRARDRTACAPPLQRGRKGPRRRALYLPARPAPLLRPARGGVRRAYLSVSAETPGRSLPSRSSSDAPPPVETWVTLSSVSYFLQQVAVSPPPITVTTPALVTSTMVSIIDLVPDSKEAISKTPIGPFQMIVLEALMAAAFSSIVLGPQSRPIMPALTPLSSVAVSIVPSSPNLDDVTKSTGSTSSTPLALAFSTICGTILAPSSS
mmetsp:Transcript_58606/g.153982  ORF Transcript_58606/g.153982 Transcript_58606/m.153982 type:complete len:239 (-) Transcript_58606:807-1523(-)